MHAHHIMVSILFANTVLEVAPIRDGCFPFSRKEALPNLVGLITSVAIGMWKLCVYVLLLLIAT